MSVLEQALVRDAALMLLHSAFPLLRASEEVKWIEQFVSAGTQEVSWASLVVYFSHAEGVLEFYATIGQSH